MFWQDQKHLPAVYRWHKKKSVRSRRNTGHRSFTGDARKGTAVSKAPEISESTVEERRAYIKAKYPCIADCDMCGLCKVFRGLDAEHAYNEYIIGKRSYHDVAADYRHR